MKTNRPGARTAVMALAARSLALWLALAGSRAAEPDFNFVGFAASQNAQTPPFAPASGTNRPTFRAVTATDWRPGLVPVFAVTKGDRWELRRRPGVGQENFSEPLFFALPPEDDPAALAISGRWEMAATRSDGSKVRVALELAGEGEKLSGRFDQNTDYRFAYLTGGTFHTNRLELEVRYIRDEYRLSAKPDGNRWLGRWRRDDDSEGGELELFRDRNLAPFVPPVGAEPVGLHECRRSGSEERRYALTGEPLPEGWERQPRPLVRVWRPASGK